MIKKNNILSKLFILMKKKFLIKTYISISIVFFMLFSTMLPIINASNNLTYIKGFDKGPSYTNIVPIEKVTFVNYDEESYLDDYAYLASVPTAVFKDQNPDENRLFSHPLLFYQEELEIENETHRSLDAYQGIKFFMEDWLEYCSGNGLDHMTLINVPQEKVSQWKAKDIISIESENIYEIAGSIALQDWSYSDNVVIAVVDDNIKEPDNKISDKLVGTLPCNNKVIEKNFKTEKLNLLNPRFHEFVVPEGYKYIRSRTWWPSIWLGKGGNSDLPVNINITIPSSDPDSQLYCKYDKQWMQVAATAGWNLKGMEKEIAESYIYTSGDWKLGITDVPTQDMPFGLNGNLLEVLKNILGKTYFHTDITIYPGTEKIIPIKPSFGCRDATFKLTWANPNIQLGFSIIGPAGEEIIATSELGQDYQEIHLDQLGECLEDEYYKISVFTMNDFSTDIDFEVEYSWEQKFSKQHADSLTSATEGAVLASQLNAPLLYISSKELSKITKDILYKLGVKNIYLLNIGNHISSSVKESLKDIALIKKEYKNVEDIYTQIMDLTGQNDIIFTTIDPWTQWYIEACKPAEETKAGLFIGPSAYCAAHHGSPVIIVDNHPELSSAVVAHTEFWKRHGNGKKEPSVAMMYLTGTRVYKFLDELKFDNDDFKEGSVETMITIGDQYEFGATWDRTFTGKANPGRIFGSPVDTAYWISHNMFYPALVFNNPAMDSNGNTLIQGSKSERSKIFPWGSVGLKIIEKSEEKKFEYPVLHTYICYIDKMNEVFEKYFGFKYKTADDIIPGTTESFNQIDEGVVSGKAGAIWPDQSGSEVAAYYFDKGGFDNVFSTSFSAIVNNLNEGVLLWSSGTHGSGQASGSLLTWDPDHSTLGSLPNLLSNRLGYTKETNPWRGYDWYLGSTENPDTMTMESHGFIAALLGNPNIDGLFPVGMDFWPSERPILHGVANLPIIKYFMPDWLKDSSYYKDGVVIAGLFSILATPDALLTGYNLDKELKNLYSCGWINTACLPAYKYIHLAMIRHGSPFQVTDPWVTSWYTYWSVTMPRDIVLGDTVGQAYTKGISHVGILYITNPPQFWWDASQNVCYFGDPDQRLYVPDTTYSEDNYWTMEETESIRYDEETRINGHMPFGATGYPHEKEPKTFLDNYLFLIIIIILILIAIFAIIKRKKSKK